MTLTAAITPKPRRDCAYDDKHVTQWIPTLSSPIIYNAF